MTTIQIVRCVRCRPSTAIQGESNPFVFTVTLKATGHQFQVASGETVLEAARRAGVALPYSCRSGVCGSCKATLLEGRCEYPRNPPLGLNADDRAHHAVLLCQTVPASDLVLAAREVTSLADITPRRLDVTVAEKWRLSRDVIGLRLQPVSDADRLFWLPGQYLDVMLEGRPAAAVLDCQRPAGGRLDRAARAPCYRWRFHLVGRVGAGGR